MSADDVDFLMYDAAIERGMPRQLARAKYNIMPDAFDQLEEAFIFHYKIAWDVFKYNFKALFNLKCTACGGRHWRKWDIPASPDGKRGRFYCGYGYKWTLTHGWRTWWYAGKHGDD